MCTRISAKKSQVLKIVAKSSHVKENFYELWKFFVDYGIYLGECVGDFLDSQGNPELRCHTSQHRSFVLFVMTLWNSAFPG